VVAEVAARLNGAAAGVDPALGLRIDTADGWWLLRASGTEAKVTCRCEAEDAEGLARLTAELYRELRASGVEPPAASSDSASR
jgi:phosphomannomutase